MKLLQPLESNNERVLTTQQLAEIYETDTDNIKKNFNNHKSNFEEGKHYYYLTGEELKEFKRQVNNIHQPINKFTSQLYLWTERGASRHCKILDTDKAWEQFDNLEETYFRAKKKPQSQLDILRGMIDQLELAQKQASEAKQIAQNIKDTIIHTDDDWRDWVNEQFIKMCRENKDYQEKKKQSYDILENRASCRLGIRLKNLRDRLKDAGATKTAINNVCKLDVIESDVRLKEIYTSIVEKMAIKYT